MISDMKILKYLSVGQTDDSRLGEMIGNHGAILRQAMKRKYYFVCIHNG